MGSPDLLKHLRDAGLSIEASDGNLIVTPRERLTDALRLAIKTHKAALLVALVAVTPATGPPPDPDRYCWPHSTAMNMAEIDRFLARVEFFSGKGVGLDAAETLADAMVFRDRDADDRRSCIECQHFSPRRKTCGNTRSSGVGPEVGDMAVKLQRCPGFQLVRQ